MAQFKSSKLKTIMHGRKMIKFDVNGVYITSDKDEIKVIQSASDVEEIKKPR